MDINMEKLEHVGIDMDMTEDELQHWGIKGMKWGVRRYQNADGSLTEAGRKRYNQEVEALKAKKEKLEQKQKNLNAQKRMQARTDKLKADIAELEGKKKPVEVDKVEEETPKTERKKRGFIGKDKPKKPEEMSLEELNAEIDRMRAVKTYKGLYSELNPPEVKKGKQTAEKLWNDGVVPAVSGAVKDVGKDFMTKLAKDALGLNEKKVKSELEKMKEAYEIADYKNKAAKADKERKDYDDEELQKAIREQAIAKSKQEQNKAKNGKSTEDILKEFLDNSDIDYTPEEKEAIKEKIDNGEFWAAVKGKI